MGGGTTRQTCSLSGFVWSPSSSNSVPVASLHVINEPSHGNSTGPQHGTMRAAVEKRFAQAFQLVKRGMDAVNAGGALSELDVSFFSAEGDVIHQLLDCLFLGPFARMDYWPLPYCTAGSPGCVQGPTWGRDDGMGATRNIDLSTCAASSESPFSCGTSTRKNMINYFVNVHVANGNGHANLVREQVNKWTQNVSAVWGDINSYACTCTPSQGGGRSVYCCPNLDAATAALTAVPDIYISAASMLQNLESLAVSFYNDSMLRVDPWVYGLGPNDASNYDWTNPLSAPDVVQSARFDPTQPSMSYTQGEAMSPPRSTTSNSLWRTCHAAIRQVMFTLPVTNEGKLQSPPPNLFSGGDTSTVAAYVEQIVAAAFDQSPLYYHYVPRHAPSHSRMCARKPVPSSAGGALKFTDVTVGGTTVFSGGGTPGLNVLGMDSGDIGGWDASCFCGWVLDTNLQCHVPADPAAQLGYSTYPLASQDRAVLKLLDPSQWGAGSCPESELSEQLGIMDRDATEAWLQGNRTLTTSGRHLLQFGPGGLKAGNFPGEDRSAQDYGGPEGPSESLDDLMLERVTQARLHNPADSVLHTCDPNNDKSVSELLTDFVDDLFPMAQGVPEAPAVSYCLRFAVEFAKLKALEMGKSLQNSSDMQAFSEYLQVVQTQYNDALKWQRRCGTQVQLVSMCAALDMYHADPSLFLNSPCSHWTFASNATVEMYLTDTCLLNVNGTFYDPCECFPSICVTGREMSFTLSANMFLSGSTNCSVSLDPRNIVRKMEMGWWSTDSIPDGNDDLRTQANEWLSNPANLLVMDDLMLSVLDPRSRVGNPADGQHWTTAQGYMNESSLYCDMIADYWPEEADFPVGYHVTVPCMASDTGYRSFDNVFSMDDMGDLVYTEDQTRDATKVDPH